MTPCIAAGAVWYLDPDADLTQSIDDAFDDLREVVAEIARPT